MHPAEEYLRNPDNPTSLYVQIGGKRRRLFINRDVDEIGIIAPKHRKRGYLFGEWDCIEKIYHPVQKDPEEENRKLVRKYQKLAAKATFQSPWLRQIAEADETKSLYENHITTGVKIEGQVISLNAIAKYEPWIVEHFREALRERKNFTSCRFEFRGYEGTLWISAYKEGDKYLKPGEISAGFSKEYRGCGNGYYYLLINDEQFIGYDID